MDKIVVIAGGNGFLGRYLSEYLMKQGWQVRVIARRPEGVAEGADYVHWDGESAGDWYQSLENASVLINMAGRTVNCRYNQTNKDQILNSRVVTTKLLGEALAKVKSAPRIWLNSSTATIYRHAEDHAQTDEEGEIGKGFSVEVAKAWEKSLFEQSNKLADVRMVALRTAMVLANEPETVYDVLANLSRKFLGGKMGNGKQMISWIHVEDFCRAICWLIDNPSAEGCYNVVAPGPMVNAEFMAKLRANVAVPLGLGLPANKWMLELGAFFLRTETELILKSRWVLPTRLQAEGFMFNFPDVDSCLADFRE